MNTNAEATDSEQYRDRIRIKKAPLEIEINRDSEPTVRRYLWENIGRSEGLTVEDAVNESAEKADCSPVTSRRHIMKACSLAGPFKIEEFQNKDYILLRDGYSPSLQSRLGQLDSQIMKERIAKAEEEKRQKEQELLAKAEQLKETEEQQQKLTKSFNKKCLEVELLQKLLKTKYGLTEEQIQKELGGMTKVLVNNEDKTTSQRPHGI
ncbi:hypothetical protein Ngar_c27980 [Candidatus Nitrososphaera gargensis Ga9.2]|uniref:Uncharacterized protein n=1 Tax=Nitrososphaera gargensis (strain Ga9.2) TaxID=1237085 RepID=K0INP2_NITGG|nr:hypothetical protein Ngar_c27980 [Candidatus Nitrososphaera gargensis Ga9.2]